jgi:hypothetical protein
LEAHAENFEFLFETVAREGCEGGEVKMNSHLRFSSRFSRDIQF